MKRFYLFAPVVLLGVFLSLYVPTRHQEQLDFEYDGPGLFAGPNQIVALRWCPNEKEPMRRGVVRDAAMIEAVRLLLEPKYGNWQRVTLPIVEPTTLWFELEGRLRRVPVQLGHDSARCGEFSRSISTLAVTDIRRRLLVKTKFVQWP
jgi:hypothetical protein